MEYSSEGTAGEVEDWNVTRSCGLTDIIGDGVQDTRERLLLVGSRGIRYALAPIEELAKDGSFQLERTAFRETHWA